MNPIWGHLIGAGIVLMTVVFLAIWYWAWRPRHKRKFDAMARLPMHDTDEDER